MDAPRPAIIPPIDFYQFSITRPRAFNRNCVFPGQPRASIRPSSISRVRFEIISINGHFKKNEISLELCRRTEFNSDTDPITIQRERKKKRISSPILFINFFINFSVLYLRVGGHLLTHEARVDKQQSNTYLYPFTSLGGGGGPHSSQ